MKKKLAHIWEYYKLHIFFTLIGLYIVGSLGYHALHKPSYGLYAGFVNVVAGKDVHSRLIDDYPACDIYTYENLLVTENINSDNLSYAQASEVKILGSIADQKLDIVIMDEEALKAFCANDYLCDIRSAVKSDELWNRIEPNLYTEYAIKLSNFSPVKDAGFSSDIYLGIIANSPRLDEVNTYLGTFLLSCEASLCHAKRPFVMRSVPLSLPIFH